MSARTHGIHHVTAFAGDPARHRRFYAATLGIPLVKRTVNFDAPSMWHLYYGHAGGAPGTLLTHFPQPGARRGRHGGEEISEVTLAAAPTELDAIARRLHDAGVAARIDDAGGRSALGFEDPDGMRIRIEARHDRSREDAALEIARVTLTVPDAEETCAFLREALGYSEIGISGEARILLALDGLAGSGRELEVVHAPELRAEPHGAGTIHHVALRVEDDDGQRTLRDHLLALDCAVTAVHDRQYFRSIYFRIPGGVLFEAATDGPGFAVDEPAGALGARLMLPPQYESARARIASTLPPLD